MTQPSSRQSAASAIVLLKISLLDVPVQSVYTEGEAVRNEHRGGPNVLLRWLETQLGLLAEPAPLSNRIIEFANLLDDCKDACFAESLRTDRWATATELLLRRDELRLAGWDEIDAPELPTLVRDLARAVTDQELSWPDLSSRLRAVVSAIESGQSLPPHRLVLEEPLKHWPALWQEVLNRLKWEQSPAGNALGPKESTLWALQDGLIAGECGNLNLDPSLRWISSCSAYTACEFVATILSAHPDRLPHTVILCEDPSVALCLDGCLSKLGMPTMGAARESLAHVAFQVLPLALNLCWEPVDPEVLLAFLSLPVGPLPKRAARTLAASLAEQPGLGSRAWEHAFKKLCDEDNDPKKSLQEKLHSWLDCPRRKRGTTLPSAIVLELCARVAQWASGYASILSEKDDSPQTLIDALHLAATQASTLRDLVETEGGELSEPQITRLRDAAMVGGAKMIPHPVASTGPRLVTSLAAVKTPCSHMIWLGVGTSDLPSCRWSLTELSDLKAAGINLDDGRVALQALREAERRGLCMVTDSLLAISLPRDAERKTHPIWLQICNALPKEEERAGRPVLLEDLLSKPEAYDTAPWRFDTEVFQPQPCQPRRAQWRVPAGLLKDRQKSSATELNDRLACPLKWVLNYQARLAPSDIARLPDTFRLKGLFAHSVFQMVFGRGGRLPDPGQAETDVGAAFDARINSDAAPLAQPKMIVERRRLRQSLCSATHELVRALRAGEYRIEGMEVAVSGNVNGRDLVGSVDCLAVRDDGLEAVVDFKFAGGKKYPELIQTGRAIQLATYAHARSQQPSARGRYPAVAYLIIDEARIVSPAENRLVGARDRDLIPDALGIDEVWNNFASALSATEAWLSNQVPIPARPLQPADEWPPGVDLVLRKPTDKGGTQKEQDVCRYCDYPALCGLKDLY
jgi:hypothetical protein